MADVKLYRFASLFGLKGYLDAMLYRADQLRNDARILEERAKQIDTERMMLEGALKEVVNDDRR